MGIKAVTVEKSQINQSVGYLAGYKGFAGDAEAFTGSGYTAEFMLMSGLSETQLDQFLAKMRAADAVIDHKATVTETNKQWSFKELIGERGRGFAGSGLLRREMGGICKGFGGCKGGFQG